MRKSIVIALTLTLTAALASAQMKQAPKGTANPSPIVVSGANRAQPGSFPRISQADAYKLYKEGKAVFIDVRSNAQYQESHIKDSLSIPGSQIVARFREVTPGKTVIAYCACSAEQSSGHAATNLVNHGVKNVWALKGGIQDWKSNGYPTASGSK
ncbi:MAG TPA: rhodanese-like domain-containing protein [Thermoanaerobaculia bacterium]|jgi:rhodanese-related sulfurtransferase|nr:rhodanese-like domain-containing protein [Thermoanaerobaculia bacterium]